MFWSWKKVLKILVLAMFFFKACQYATRDEKVYKWLKYVFIKFASKHICKNASLDPEIYSKGKHEWN
jgi:hypothetical protein